jgi:metallothiol transferase
MEKVLEALVDLLERRSINKRQFIHGVLGAIAPIAAHDSAYSTESKQTSGFHGRTLNHITLSVTDVKRSAEFYQKLLGASVLFQTAASDRLQGINLGMADAFLGIYKIAEPGVHHFSIGVENYSVETALQTLKTDFPESKPVLARGGEELYFRDPDGILGQISSIDYRGAK